jgi:TrmH family RNA methyltransferase
MGGTFRLPIAARGTLPEVIDAAQELGVRLVAAVPRGGTPLPALDLRRPTAIVLGGEGSGLPLAAMTAMHETVTIPMRKPVESLNVAIAAALLLYEASRQRQG